MGGPRSCLARNQSLWTPGCTFCHLDKSFEQLASAFTCDGLRRVWNGDVDKLNPYVHSYEALARLAPDPPLSATLRNLQEWAYILACGMRALEGNIEDCDRGPICTREDLKTTCRLWLTEFWSRSKLGVVRVQSQAKGCAI